MGIKDSKPLLIYHKKTMFYKEDEEMLTKKVRIFLSYCFDKIDDDESKDALIVDQTTDFFLSEKFNKVFATGNVEINFALWEKLINKNKFKEIKEIFERDLDIIVKKLAANDKDFSW